MNNAHQGGVFVLLSCDDGTLVSGGKDKRLVVWDQDLNRTGMEYELPDKYGTARSLAQSSTLQLLVGTNRNCLIQGHFHTGFNLVVQVCDRGAVVTCQRNSKIEDFMSVCLILT